MTQKGSVCLASRFTEAPRTGETSAIGPLPCAMRVHTLRVVCCFYAAVSFVRAVRRGKKMDHGGRDGGRSLPLGAPPWCAAAGCACPTARVATLVIAGSCFGSTWLGQLLDAHPCAVGFIDRGGAGRWADGKFRRAPAARLIADLSFGARGLDAGPAGALANCSARGLMLTPDEARRLGLAPPLPAASTAASAPRVTLQENGDASGRHVSDASSSTSSANESLLARLRAIAQRERHPVRVLALTRVPFYVALSRVKKHALAGRADCANLNQRGRPGLCAGINASTTVVLDPVALDRAVTVAERDVADVRAVARAIGAALSHPIPGAEEESGGHVGEDGHDTTARPPPATGMEAPSATTREVHHRRGTRRRRMASRIGGPLSVDNEADSGAPSEELGYSELLSSGTVPLRVLGFVGLGSSAVCAAVPRVKAGGEGGVTSTKSSPREPLDAVSNRAELLSWAEARAAPWLEYVGSGH